MKVAITGISGYLGGLLAPLVDAEQEVESILGLDIVEPEFKSDKLKFEHADVCNADFGGLLRGIDVLYHLAFIVEPPRGMGYEAIDEINIEGSKRVFEGAVAAGVGKIIYASSVAAYGSHADNAVPLTEESPLRPNEDWYYSKAKGLLEFFLDELQEDNPRTLIVRFRPAIFVGPTVNNPMKQALTGRLFFEVDEKIKWDLVWDGDVAEAFRLALHYDKSDTFCLSGEEPLRPREMCDLLDRRIIRLPLGPLMTVLKIGQRIGLVAEGTVDWMRSSDGPIVVSARRARERLGWKPTYNTAETLIKFNEAMGTMKKKGGK